MTPLRTLTLALAAALASGCTMIPEYQRPAAPVPASFPNNESGVSPAAAATPADAIAWHDYFADDRLREVITLALANNRDLRVAALNIEKARAQYRIQRADLFPAIGATGSQNAQRLPGDLTSSGEADISRSYSATIGFSAYELDFFGRIRSLNAQALELYLGTEDARRSAQISLVAEVASIWLTLAYDRERLVLARNTHETRLKSHDLIRRSSEAGAVSALDVHQSQLLLQSARADVSRFSSFVAQDENALALVVGAPVPADLLPATLTDTVSAVAELPAGVPSEVLTRRPDILQAERSLRAANASIGAPRAAVISSKSQTPPPGNAHHPQAGRLRG
ncbi:MAG: efflux transporter outer membrane subunit, partial [Thiobacillus sp.]|nr:efflux transporter outer membrane subunit [Thiobacillus sp.]